MLTNADYVGPLINPAALSAPFLGSVCYFMTIAVWQQILWTNDHYYDQPFQYFMHCQ